MKNGFMRLNISFLIPVSFLIATLSAPLGKSEEYVSYTKVGDEIPAFSVTTLDGKDINTGVLKGKVVLLNFWATWCPPCHAEIPRLQKEIWEKYTGRGFEMVAIAREQTRQEITKYRDKNKLSFPMAADPKRAIYAKFANAGIPRNYIINPDAKIVYQSYGYSSDDFEKMINVLEKELAKLGNRSGK
jgi:peroxiredoxin